MGDSAGDTRWIPGGNTGCPSWRYVPLLCSQSISSSHCSTLLELRRFLHLQEVDRHHHFPEYSRRGHGTPQNESRCGVHGMIFLPGQSDEVRVTEEGLLLKFPWESSAFFVAALPWAPPLCSLFIILWWTLRRRGGYSLDEWGRHFPATCMAAGVSAWALGRECLCLLGTLQQLEFSAMVDIPSISANKGTSPVMICRG